MPKADGDTCDDDKLRQNAVRDVVRVDEAELVDCVPCLLLVFVAQQTEKVGQKPNNGNDLVPLSGCVSDGLAEALGLEIDNEASF